MRRSLRDKYDIQIRALKYQLKESRRARFTAILVLIAIILVIIAIIVFAIINATKDKKIPTLHDGMEIAESFVEEEIIGSEGELIEVDNTPALSELIAINQLRTVTYNYSTICTIVTNNGPVYYLCYEAEVVLGIDMSRVYYEIDEKTQVITIILPNVEVQESTVIPSTIDYIFVDNAYDNPETGAAAQRLCEQDLASKLPSDQTMRQYANSRTEDEVEALIKPLLDQYYPEYELVVTYQTTGGNTNEG